MAETKTEKAPHFVYNPHSAVKIGIKPLIVAFRESAFAEGDADRIFT